MRVRSDDEAKKIQEIQDFARPVLRKMAKSNADMTDQLDDICQEVVVRVITKLASGAEIHDLAVYVRQVARNEFKRAQRKHIRRRELDAAGAVRAEVPGDPDSAVDRNQRSVTSVIVRFQARSLAKLQVRRLQSMSGPLNRNQRRVLKMQMEGHSAAEIAEELGLAGPHVVDSIAYQARVKARNSLRSSPDIQQHRSRPTTSRFRG